MFGLVNIRKGSVQLRGEEITNMKAHSLVSRGIGYVPQTNNVFPSLTIRQLEMGTFIDPSRFAERLVGEMFPKLIDRRDQRAGSLSGGERQMLAMGRALMLDPSVLLDEPSAGLSPALQDEVFVRCLESIAGVSIVMVEQNAKAVCRFVIVATFSTKEPTPTPGLAEIFTDPKVIELYLGTLVKSHQD